ncbi:MAG: polysaccharide biosynthesis tyrosine autokinase [Chlorobi bacterium]|nr:polysaccharide biosynthesis tyrosine autokinase [Chlorobiota bacterium]
MQERTGTIPPIKQPSGDGVFDFNRILKLVLRNWYLFLISLPLTLGAVYIYHRYTVPVYRATTSILLKSDRSGSLSQSNLIEGFGLSPEIRNIENQIFIIKSKKLVRKAIDLLDFEVEYYRAGRMKDAEIYHSSPFVVVFDSLHPQMLNVPFYISCLNKNSVKVEISTEGANTFLYGKDKNAGFVGTYDFTKTVKWGETVSTPYFSFKLKKLNNSVCEQGGKFYFKFRSPDYIANVFRSRLSVGANSEGSSIMHISVTGTSPGKLVNFLDKLNIVIMENSLERKNDMATRSINFISSQLKKVSDTLENVQKKMLAFRKSNHFVVPSEYSQMMTDQYFEKEKKLNVLRIKKEYYLYIQRRLKEDAKSEDFMLPAISDETNGLVNQLVMELFTLKEEYETLTANADSPNPYISSLSQKIVIAESNLQVAIRQVLKNIELQEKELKDNLKVIVNEIKDIPELEKEYADIERNYKLNDAIYTFLLQKHSENQIAKASNTPDNEVIDSPYVSGIVSPNKKSNYSKAFMLGLLLPIALIFLKELLNTKVRGKEDLEHLQDKIPLLGVIMHNKAETQDVIHEQPHSVVSEAFRSLRTKIKFMSCQNDTWAITITSTNTGEGKTFCAQNLASAFSITGKKTVLLGFDMRKPRLSAIFDLSEKIGISSYLTNQAEFEDICYKTDYDNLFVVPSGAIPPNPSELISGEKTGQLFKLLRERFEVIIIDTPPIGLVADARILMDYSDCHLYVVRANYTNKEHMGYSLNNLLLENISHMGMILNDVSLKDKGYGYYSAEYYG